MYDNFLLYFVQTKKSYPLSKGEVIVAGKSRNESNLYLLPYFEGAIKTISGSHFKLCYKPHGLFIEDLASTNGTEVNGEPLSPEESHRLFHSDMIRIAKNDDFIIEVINESSRTDVISPSQPEPFTVPANGIYFYEDENTFYLDGKAIEGLKPRAMEVLKYLYQHKKRECSSYDILKDVFSSDTSIHSVRAAIKDIRAKFEEINPESSTRYLRTIHGYGYKLVTE